MASITAKHSFALYTKTTKDHDLPNYTLLGNNSRYTSTKIQVSSSILKGIFGHIWPGPPPLYHTWYKIFCSLWKHMGQLVYPLHGQKSSSQMGLGEVCLTKQYKFQVYSTLFNPLTSWGPTAHPLPMSYIFHWESWWVPYISSSISSTVFEMYLTDVVLIMWDVLQKMSSLSRGTTVQPMQAYSTCKAHIHLQL